MKKLTLFLFSLAPLWGQTETKPLWLPSHPISSTDCYDYFGQKQADGSKCATPVVGPPVVGPLTPSFVTPDGIYIWNGLGFVSDQTEVSSLNIQTSDGGRAVITPDGSITYLDGATPESTIKALIKIVQQQSEQIGKLYNERVDKKYFDACMAGWKLTAAQMQQIGQVISTASQPTKPKETKK